MLKSCTKAVSRIRKAKKQSKRASAADEEEPDAVDVLVDIIIGFMETATAFSRSLAKLVFSNITNDLTEGSIDLLLAVRSVSLKFAGCLNLIASGTEDT